jgi:hypothetical protein
MSLEPQIIIPPPDDLDQMIDRLTRNRDQTTSTALPAVQSLHDGSPYRLTALDVFARTEPDKPHHFEPVPNRWQALRRENAAKVARSRTLGPTIGCGPWQPPIHQHDEPFTCKPLQTGWQYSDDNRRSTDSDDASDPYTDALLR